MYCGRVFSARCFLPDSSEKKNKKNLTFLFFKKNYVILQPDFEKVASS